MKNRLIPPTYFNLFIPSAIVLHFVMPIRRIIHPPANTIGLALIALGLGLNMWSVRTMKRAKTTTDFNKTPDRLVLEGPFRFSRHPIYLSGVILSTGVAITLGSLVTFTFPIALFILLDRLYIPVEEKSLEMLFGSPYLDYKTRVRRWI